MIIAGNDLVAIAQQAALCLQGRDWHRLTAQEQFLCDKLESAGYLAPSKNGGFIGKVTFTGS